MDYCLTLSFEASLLTRWQLHNRLRLERRSLSNLQHQPRRRMSSHLRLAAGLVQAAQALSPLRVRARLALPSLNSASINRTLCFAYHSYAVTRKPYFALVLSSLRFSRAAFDFSALAQLQLQVARMSALGI